MRIVFGCILGIDITAQGTALVKLCACGALDPNSSPAKRQETFEPSHRGGVHDMRQEPGSFGVPHLALGSCRYKWNEDKWRSRASTGGRESTLPLPGMVV